MAEETYDDPLESAEYSSKSDLSKAEKVANQISTCSENRSKEMKEGYFNYDKLGNKVTIPDSRKEWVSSVIALRLLLRPEIQRDKTKCFVENNFNTKEKELIERWGIEIEKDKKIIPLLDESFPIEFKVMKKNGSSAGKVKTQMVKGKFNPNFHRYWDDMVKLYDEMYAQLNVLIDQCNYFKQEVSY